MKRFRDPSSLSSTGLGVSARIPLDDKGSADDDDDWKVLNVGAWWYSLDVEVVLESLSTILDLWGNHHGHVWFFCRVWHVVFSHVTSFHVFFQILQLWCRVTCEVDVVSSWQVPDKQVLEPTLFHRHTVNRVSAPRSTVVSSERWSVVSIDHHPRTELMLCTCIPHVCTLVLAVELFPWFCDVKEPLTARTSTIHQKTRGATVPTVASRVAAEVASLYCSCFDCA